MNMIKYEQNRKNFFMTLKDISIIKSFCTTILFKLIGFLILFSSLWSCEDYFHPEQELVIKQEDMFNTWEEYRSAGMGLYALQQNLFEQIVILGELRGDLVSITENASSDLVEIYKFNISKENTYSTPFNFYKLIAQCNNLLRQLQNAHPEVLDKSKEITNYDLLYGEVLCMQAWAYFNAVRIYQKVPYIPESLNTIYEIRNYVNSELIYIDSIDYIYGSNGAVIDTIVNNPVRLEKRYMDLETVIDTFTYKLENKIKAVGVNYSINNGDVSWFATVWNNYAKHALLGEMYLFDLNYVKALENFRVILYNQNYIGTNIRFGLDQKFSNTNWQNIFSGIDPDEHILTLWFNSAYRQTNELQSMFSIFVPNKYMLKPTRYCIDSWETIWRNMSPITLSGGQPYDSAKIANPGIPGDYYRGYGVSYVYVKNGIILDKSIVEEMLNEKLEKNDLKVRSIMSGVDTVVNKFSIGRSRFSNDASFIIYRAADIHLYTSLIYAMMNIPGVPSSTQTGLSILNTGAIFNIKGPMGVRGRVGFGTGTAAINLIDPTYFHDPYTNEIIGYKNWSADDLSKRLYLSEKILEERVRELAFEGKRFYDLMLLSRIKKDNSYLADKVASKFSGAEKEEIKAKLMDSNNWYIQFYE